MSAHLSDVRSFVQCWKEVTAISESLSSHSPDDTIKGCVDHYRNLEAVAKIFNLTPSNAEDHHQIRRLSETIVVSGGYESFEEIYQVVKDVHKKLADDGEFLDLIDYKGEVSSLTSVRVSLLGAAFEIYRIARTLQIADYKAIIHAHFEVTIKLSQDVAFNWRTTSTYGEREVMFCEILPYCSQLTLSQLKDQIQQLGSGLVATKVSVMSALEDFEMALEDDDMGYAHHDTLTIDWLKNQVSDRIIAKSERYLSMMSGPQYLKSVMLSRYIESLCQIMSYAWRDASSELYARIDSMTEEEQIAFCESEEGRAPMSLDSVFKHFETLSVDADSPVRFKLNETALMSKTSEAFASVWGVSDSLFRHQGA